MKIRSIALTNVRKFAGQTVMLSGIGDGVSVVSEPNEFGKSTFFDALRALFFEKYGSTAKAIKSLQPYSGGLVKVSAEIESNGVTYQVEKRWLSQKGALIRNLPSRSIVAQDGEAEDWISRLIGESREGPAGLLWVRQGVTSLEPPTGTAAEKAENERLTQTRRDLLSSVAGEIEVMTGGRRMDKILRRCVEDLAKLTTQTGRPSGVWKGVQDEVDQLTLEHSKLSKSCDDLVHSLISRKETEGRIASLDSPSERATREKDLQQAQDLERIAEAHAGQVETAKSKFDVANLKLETAREQSANFYGALQRLEKAKSVEKELSDIADKAKKRVAELNTAEQNLRQDHESTLEALKSNRSKLEIAHRIEYSKQGQARLEELVNKLDLAKKFRSESEKLSATLSTDKATPQWLKGIENLDSEFARVKAVQLANAVQITARYIGEKRIMLADQLVPAEVATPLPKHARLVMPDIGELQIDAVGSKESQDLERDIETLSRKLTQQLSICGVMDLPAANERARIRQGYVEAEKLATNSLHVTAPEGIEKLEVAVAEAEKSALQTIGSADQIQSAGELSLLVAGSERQSEALRRDLANAESQHGEAREKFADSLARHEAAAKELTSAEQDCGPIDQRDARQKELHLKLSVLQLEAGTADALLKSLITNAPDLATAKANYKRAKGVVEGIARELKELGERHSALSATIASQASIGIEEMKDEIFGRLETARARNRAFAVEVAALQHLKSAVQAARVAAKEAYFGPVQDELAPLLRILHDDAVLSFDDATLLPTSLHRGNDDEELGALSGGTQEQIAILTRLAFANLLAKQGKELPIILDDALVYSDDTRIIKMFTALHRTAVNQQIIVFTCRQLAFANLGGEKPVLRVSEMS